MKSRFYVCALICSAILMPQAFSSDDQADPLDEVDAAEETFDKEIDAAKGILLEEYRKEIVKQTEAGKLENITRLTTGLQIFESDGFLMEPELEDQYKAFGKASRDAKGELLKSYQIATAKLAAAGHLNELQEIQQKIRDRGLIAKLVSIQLISNPKFHVMHEGYKGYVREIPRHQRLNATFEMVIGLSTEGIVRESMSKSGIQGRPSELVSFRAVNAPDFFLAHGNHELILQKYIEADGFRQNASFKIQKGLSQSSAISLEAVNVPDHFLIMKADGSVRLEKRQATAEFSRAATFKLSGPKFRLW
jgi:hypothetical protein